MPTQQFVYALGLFNLTLAGIAVFCVAEAENRPEHFALVYVAVSIFAFYMGTILVIIVLQIIETRQEQEARRTTLMQISVPVLKASVISPGNATSDDSAITSMKRPAAPLTRSSCDFEDSASGVRGQSTSLTLLRKPSETIGTIDENEELSAVKSIELRSGTL